MTKRKDKKGRKGKSRARKADRYDLYQKSVQEPSCEVDFFDRAYRRANRRLPKVLREDFCGTFAVCCEWVKKRGRTAIGVDLDPEPLAWGREHNLSRLPAEAQKRVRLLQKDVRSVGRTKADVLAAQNFSYWIFKTREELRAYFRTARRNLAPDGIMVLDLMGGSDCLIEDHTDVRKYKGFRYLWEQARFDPITHDAKFHIHFKFKDGSKLKRAFTYEWRFWTIPEIRELLVEAGFSDTTVYWEGTDEETGEGNGEWSPAASAPSDDAWIAYVVARR
ncbi:MAG: SAM-dependent methyltransferase [Planctomycetota bacterium]